MVFVDLERDSCCYLEDPSLYPFWCCPYSIESDDFSKDEKDDYRTERLGQGILLLFPNRGSNERYPETEKI
jgi:hypothetical protein